MLASLADRGGRPQGWGEYGSMHELVIEVGERIDLVIYTIQKALGGNPPEPMRWRRPGVLGAYELNELLFRDSWEVIDQLEAERAEREARRRAEKAALTAGQTTT